jgi:hypothetical protein
MSNKFDILSEYRKIFRATPIEEDGMSMAPTSDAANAPAGAMSSAPYMDQVKDNPKLAVYNHQTKKKKCFTTEEDMDAFMKENPEWSKKPIEEAKGYYSADASAAKSFLYKHKNTLDTIFGAAVKGDDFNKDAFDTFVKALNEFNDKHVTSHNE